MPSKIEQLTITELKSRLLHAAKRSRELMAPMLYHLREKLKAQGKSGAGFGAWVEKNLDITRRTADRWADEYGISAGLKKKRPRSATFGQMSKGSAENDPDTKFYEQELERHAHLIQFTKWVTKKDYAAYQRAVGIIQKHFQISSTREAVLKGVQYAAEAIAAAPTTGYSGERIATGRAGRLERGNDAGRAGLRKTAHSGGENQKRAVNGSGRVPDTDGAGGHRSRKSPQSERRVAGRKAFHTAAG